MGAHAKGRHCLLLAATLRLLSGLPGAAQQVAPDWQLQVRQQVARQELNAALATVERRLTETPDDLEATGWHGRLLGWMGRWEEAEAEYRKVLQRVPNDIDILLGLAGVVARQQRGEEALTLLARAQQLDPLRADVLSERGRVLLLLGRADQAREAFRAALALEPGNAEAEAALASLKTETRHEFRVGNDTDFFNYTDTAQAQTVGLRSAWNSRWRTTLVGNVYQRFGEDAGEFAGSATYRLSPRDALTVGASVGRDQGVIPKHEAFFEYGHGFRLSEHGLFRGIDTNYRQQWLWFASARVLALTESVVLYLPREWTLSLAVTPARSSFPSTGAEWRPSGITRLGFPLHRQVSGNLFFAVGTENFARVDQIGRFSARTFGGGVRYQFTPRQDLSGYGAHQSRSQGRTQTSFGISYGFHF